jgi:hypothetical protein
VYQGVCRGSIGTPMPSQGNFHTPAPAICVVFALFLALQQRMASLDKWANLYVSVI